MARTGLPRDQVYFTATHTHGGPGGWGIHPLERLVAGTYRPEVFDLLAERLAEVVLESRARLRPAELAFIRTEVPGMQRNRILEGEPTNDILSAWIVRAADSARPGSTPAGLATLVSFGAHATIGHPIPPRLGGDYPAALAVALPKLVDAGVVLFAAGTVGDASPVRLPASNQQQSVEAYAAVLAARLAALFPAARFESSIHLVNRHQAVFLPPASVPFLALRSASAPGPPGGSAVR